MEKIETVIIGAGQAGLATSYHLKQLGKEHIVFEAADIPAHVWRDDRWDSFTFVLPNWTFQLPGAKYDGDNPDGFLPKEEIVAYFQRYVDKFKLPIRFNTPVLEVSPMDGGGYQVRTEAGTVQAKNVVIATGSFQKPKIPAYGANIPKDILQLHSGHYRNPKELPDGAVLVVGAGQSGMQITEELYQSGRTVFLAAGFTPRVPRRYRGKDVIAWLTEIGFMSMPVEKLPSPKARMVGNPHVSGKDGGHSLNLHQFARDGVKLLGHIAGAQDGKVTFKPDLKETLAKMDKSEQDIVAMIDRYIEANHLNIPQETLPDLKDGYSIEAVTELDLKAEYITTIIWAMGYLCDYSFVKLPVVDEDGFPVTQGGVTQYPGLYFVGTNWLSRRNSVTLFGMNQDVEHVVAEMVRR